MQWASLLLALAKLFSQLLQYANDRQLLKAGEEQAIADVLRQQANLLEKANHAREAARARNSAVPKSDSLPDDGFRRSDG